MQIILFFGLACGAENFELNQHHKKPDDEVVFEHNDEVKKHWKEIRKKDRVIKTACELPEKLKLWSHKSPRTPADGGESPVLGKNNRRAGYPSSILEFPKEENRQTWQPGKSKMQLDNGNLEESRDLRSSEFENLKPLESKKFQQKKVQQKILPSNNFDIFKNGKIPTELKFTIPNQNQVLIKDQDSNSTQPSSPSTKNIAESNEPINNFVITKDMNIFQEEKIPINDFNITKDQQSSQKPISPFVMSKDMNIFKNGIIPKNIQYAGMNDQKFTGIFAMSPFERETNALTDIMRDYITKNPEYEKFLKSGKSLSAREQNIIKAVRSINFF